MRRMVWAPAVLVALLACATAQAAPVTVNLRVEGASSTIFEGPVTTDGKVDRQGREHARVRRHHEPRRIPGPGPTVDLGARRRAARGRILVDRRRSFDDFFDAEHRRRGQRPTTPVLGLSRSTTVPLEVGGCQQQVAHGRRGAVRVRLLRRPARFAERPLLRLRGPAGRPPVSRWLVADEFTCRRRPTSSDAAGRRRDGRGRRRPARTARPTVTFDAPGLKRLKAERAGSIRSNAVLLCVSETGTGTAAVPAGQLGSTPDRGKVTDSAAPAARISGPRNGRTLPARAAAAEGRGRRRPRAACSEVKIALRRHVRGQQLPVVERAARAVRRDASASKMFFFSIGNDAQLVVPAAARARRRAATCST